MNRINVLHVQITQDLEHAGEISLYSADANEPDSRYKSYGVRAAGKKQIFRTHRASIRQLEPHQQIELAEQLITSGFGEQQEIGLRVLEPFADYYSPSKFHEIDRLVRYLYGWSKVDAFTGSLLRDILFQHPSTFPSVVQTWNQESDQWLRRASVVLFTRKVANSGKFTDIALEMCNNLIHAPEDLVRKGVGWALKDLMRSDKNRIRDYVQQLRKQNVSRVIISYAIRDLKGQERIDFLAK